MLVLLWLYFTWAAFVSVHLKATATDGGNAHAPVPVGGAHRGNNADVRESPANEGENGAPGRLVTEPPSRVAVERPSQSLPTQIQKQFIL